MTNVLIAGAGPTGLTLACLLARAGVSVRLVDKSPEFPSNSRGKGLNARSLEVFDEMGIGSALHTVGRDRMVFRKYFNGEFINDTDPFEGAVPTPEARYTRGLMLPQWRVENELRRLLASHGVEVERGSELVGFSDGGDRVTATLAGGEQIESDYLIGCDGGRSSVRNLLGVSFAGTSAPEQAMFCGDVEVDGNLDRTVWHQWFTPEGGVLLCPFEGTPVWQFQSKPELDVDGRMLEPSLESFQRLFDRHARMPGVKLRNATWLSTWRVNVRMVDRYRVGRVFLAGDAAHVHPIAGGLGMNTGIQDAWNLGWKLAHVLTGQAHPELLDTYQEERLPIAAWTLDLTSTAATKTMEAVPKPGVGVEVVVSRDVLGLGIHYRWSSLAEEHDQRPEGAARAGDRAPDSPCQGPDGRPIRLMDRCNGGVFTLLTFGSPTWAALDGRGAGLCTLRIGSEPGSVGSVDLIDSDGHARRAYGMAGGGLVLVRPDLHVALTAPGEGLEAVRAYLRRLGHPAA